MGAVSTNTCTADATHAYNIMTNLLFHAYRKYHELSRHVLQECGNTCISLYAWNNTIVNYTTPIENTCNDSLSWEWMCDSVYKSSAGGSEIQANLVAHCDKGWFSLFLYIDCTTHNRRVYGLPLAMNVTHFIAFSAKLSMVDLGVFLHYISTTL